MLFLPYPRPLSYSPVYFTFCCQNHCNSSSMCPIFFSKGSSQFSRSVPLLKSLHCALSHCTVHYPIIFKISTIAYQALSSTHPVYLKSMLAPARNSGQLQSISGNPLYIPRVKTKAATRAFSTAAPTLWNSLPASVKLERNIVSFCRRLKSYL